MKTRAQSARRASAHHSLERIEVGASLSNSDPSHTAGERQAVSGIGLGFVRNRQADTRVGCCQMLCKVFAVRRYDAAEAFTLAAECRQQVEPDGMKLAQIHDGF